MLKFLKIRKIGVLSLELKTDELETFKQILLVEKRDKVLIQEELLQMYIQSENLLNAYESLQSKYDAISQSKLGKLTYIYWKLLKRIKRG